MNNKIDASDIVMWKENKVSVLFLECLEEKLIDGKEQRLSRALVTDPNGVLKQNYYLGYEDAILDMLDMLKFDINQEVVDEDNEKL